MKEIWKDIKGYEGLYQISNYGRLKSLERKVKNNNSYRIVKEKIMKPIKLNTGYYSYGLRKDGSLKQYLVHRLIAEYFIDNELKMPIINHIDGNKENNKIENLEWCDYSHNIKEAFKLGLNKYTYEKNFKHNYWKNKFGKNHNCSKKIIQFDLENNFIKEWESMTFASLETKINIVSISKNCNNKQKTAGGYIWKFKEEK